MNVIYLSILKLFHSLYKSDSSNKKQTHNITSAVEIEAELKNSIKESRISTSEEADLVRPMVSEKNKWLYPTNEFGKMERGVVD